MGCHMKFFNIGLVGVIMGSHITVERCIVRDTFIINSSFFHRGEGQVGKREEQSGYKELVIKTLVKLLPGIIGQLSVPYFH